LLDRDLVNFTVNDDQFGVSAINRALESRNFLARQLRVYLGYTMLDGLDGALELFNALPVTGKQCNGQSTDLFGDLFLQHAECWFAS